MYKNYFKKKCFESILNINYTMYIQLIYVPLLLNYSFFYPVSNEKNSLSPPLF